MTISVDFPRVSDVVPAGQSGTISATLSQSYINFFRYVDIFIYNDKNQTVWSGQGIISGESVKADVKWPDLPGKYEVHAKCCGPLANVLAEHRVPFTVVDKHNFSVV